VTLRQWIPGTNAWVRRREGVLCAKTVQKVQQIVDGELTGTRAAQVLERHLEACKSCDREAEVFRQLKVAICRVEGEADPALVASLEDMARRLCSGEQLPE